MIPFDQFKQYNQFPDKLRIKVRANSLHPLYEQILAEKKTLGFDYIPWTYTIANDKFMDEAFFNQFDIQPLLRPMENFTKEIDFYQDKFIPSERTTIDDTDALLKWNFNVFEIEDFHPILT